MTSQEVLKVLQPIPLDFGASAVGCRPVTVHIEFKNPGHLPAVWELHSNEQPEIEVERWVEPVRPSNEQEKLVDFIVENNIFMIEPKSGELLPGERVQVTMVYTPLQEGVFLPRTARKWFLLFTDSPLRTFQVSTACPYCSKSGMERKSAYISKEEACRQRQHHRDSLPAQNDSFWSLFHWEIQLLQCRCTHSEIGVLRH